MFRPELGLPEGCVRQSGSCLAIGTVEGSSAVALVKGRGSSDHAL